MSSELHVRFPNRPFAVRILGGLPSSRGPRSAMLTTSGASSPPPQPVAAAPIEHQRVQEAITQLRRSVDQGLESIEHRVEAEIRALEPQLVSLAVGIVKKLLGHARANGGFDPSELVQDALRRVTEGLREPRPVIVRAPAATIALLSRGIAASETADPGPRTQFIADASLAPGTCEVDCDMRRVRIDLDRELARIERALAGGSTADGGAA